jgi:hypothetical protein
MTQGPPGGVRLLCSLACLCPCDVKVWRRGCPSFWDNQPGNLGAVRGCVLVYPRFYPQPMRPQLSLQLPHENQYLRSLVDFFGIKQTCRGTTAEPKSSSLLLARKCLLTHPMHFAKQLPRTGLWQRARSGQTTPEHSRSSPVRLFRDPPIPG